MGWHDMKHARIIRQLRTNLQGNALVELALLLPVVAVLLTGIIDFGFMARDAIALNAAARAGAQYGFANPTDGTGIQTAALDASSLASSNLTVTEACQCYDGAAVSCAGPCTGSDLDSGQSRIYLTVKVTEPFHTLLPWPGISDPTTLTGTAVLPVQTEG